MKTEKQFMETHECVVTDLTDLDTAKECHWYNSEKKGPICYITGHCPYDELVAEETNT